MSQRNPTSVGWRASALKTAGQSLRNSRQTRQCIVPGRSFSQRNSALMPRGCTVVFEVDEGGPLPQGHVISVVGSVAEIGSWQPEQAVPLALVPGSQGLWSGPVSLPDSASVEYKLVRGPPRSNNIAWESIGNRRLQVPKESEMLLLVFKWNTSGESAKVVEAPEPEIEVPVVPEVLQVPQATAYPDQDLQQDVKEQEPEPQAPVTVVAGSTDLPSDAQPEPEGLESASLAGPPRAALLALAAAVVVFVSFGFFSFSDGAKSMPERFAMMTESAARMR